MIGRIFDATTQKAIKDAIVIIPGTTSRTFSNQLGFFEISVDTLQHKTLIISHVGFKISELKIPYLDRFKLLIQKDTIQLTTLNLSQYPKSTLRDLETSSPRHLAGVDFPDEEAPAIFPGGALSFYEFMGNSLADEIPRTYSDHLEVKFTINEIGKAVDIVVSDTTLFIKNVMSHTFKNMPDWKPATQRKNNVPQYFVMPIARLGVPDINSSDLKEFYSFIGKEIRYPAQARRIGAEGVVIVKFQLDDFGGIWSFRLLQDFGAGCDDEVKRVFSILPGKILSDLSMKAKSTPLILPISFGLGEPYKIKIKLSDPGSFLLGELAITGYGSQERIPLNSSTRGPKPTPQQITFPGSTQANNPEKILNDAMKEPLGVNRLSLIDGNLKDFPLGIVGMSNLEFLDLERNSINALPDGIANLSKLKELYLFKNKLESLPKSFALLKKMKILGLASNQLKLFPMEITQLEKLEALDLSDNQLTALPPAIGNLKNLKILVLKNNKIKELPQEFFALTKLEKIYIQGNPMILSDIELLKKHFNKAEIVAP